MATVDECRAALQALAAKMDAKAKAQGDTIDLDRPLACTVTDLGVAFHGRITGGRLIGLTDGDDQGAKIRLIARSDDLVSLIAGDLDIVKAWTAGKITIKANPFDLLKLRKLM